MIRNNDGTYNSESNFLTFEVETDFNNSNMSIYTSIIEYNPDKDGNYKVEVSVMATDEAFDMYKPNSFTETMKIIEVHNVSENLGIEALVQKITDDFYNRTNQYVKVEELRAELKGVLEKYTLSEAQQEYFKDSKLRDDKGHLVPCSHYTNHQFDTFDKDKITGDSYCGRGFYFTSRNDFGSGFGHNKVECYINMEKPFILAQIEDKDNFLWAMAQSQEYKNGELSRIEGYPQKSESYMSHMLEDALEYHAWSDDIKDTIDEILDSSAYQDFLESGNVEDLGYYIDDLKNNEEFMEVASEQGFEDLLNLEMLTIYDLDYYNFHHGTWNDFAPYFTDYAKENGYDGILLDMHDGSCTEIVVFEPNQIKAVENRYPTKDDNFRDNKEEYMKLHSKPLTLEDKINAAKQKKIERQHSNNSRNKDMEL